MRARFIAIAPPRRSGRLVSFFISQRGWFDVPRAIVEARGSRDGLGWRPEEEMALEQMWRAGVALRQVAQLLGRTVGGVEAKGGALGLPPLLACRRHAAQGGRALLRSVANPSQ